MTSIKKPHHQTTITSLRGRSTEKEYNEITQTQAETKLRNNALRNERLQRRNDRKREHDGTIKISSPEGGSDIANPKMISDPEGDPEGDPAKLPTIIREEIQHTPEEYSATKLQVAEETTIHPYDELFYNLENEIGINNNHSNLETMKAFKAVADPDVMYMHQAMKQHDKHC